MAQDPKNKKYLFDLHNFDSDAEVNKKKGKEPPEPTFSIQDMDQARVDSYEKGKAEGLQAAKESIEQRTEVVIQSIASHLAQLEASEAIRQRAFEQDSLILIYKTLSKVFNPLFDESKSQLIENFLQSFFQNTQMRTGFVLTVHPDVEEAVKKHIQSLPIQIDLETNSNISPNAAQIDWKKGTALYNPEDMAQKLLGIIADKVEDKAELLDDEAKTPHNKEIADISGSNSEDEDKA